MLTNIRNVEIEWGDCDAAGIVFYPRYFAIFDASTAYLFEKALGMKKPVWTKTYGIVGIPMVDTGATFHIPASFGDIITIESRVSSLGKSSIGVEHMVTKDGALAIEAHEKRVWVAKHPDDETRIKAVAIPQAVRAALTG